MACSRSRDCASKWAAGHRSTTRRERQIFTGATTKQGREKFSASRRSAHSPGPAPSHASEEVVVSAAGARRGHRLVAGRGGLRRVLPLIARCATGRIRRGRARRRVPRSLIAARTAAEKRERKHRATNQSQQRTLAYEIHGVSSMASGKASFKSRSRFLLFLPRSALDVSFPSLRLCRIFGIPL